MIFRTLKVVQFSILQLKPVLIFPHGNFTDRFSESVIMIGTVNWLIVFDKSQQISIPSATIICTLIQHQLLLLVT